jgi:NAD(P)-dependent dehydrogenase (short-subunit alcohol dehydrogenase family)
MTIKFTDQVAIVTGAGNGLGRSHALSLAARGAKVVVNDLGGSVDGSGGSSAASQEVVKLIEDNGGQAMAHGANVAKFDEVEDMVQQALSKWGRVDVLINNAGILRDKSFAKGSLDDFKLVMDVHLMGSVNCCKAVWETMRTQNYGRILMTTSSSGLYGNFGQTNYGAAKMAVVGLMNTLVLEGGKYNIKVNSIAPSAATRMTEALFPPEALDTLTAQAVSAGALALVHEDAPNRYILCAGAGGYSSTRLFETEGIYLGASEQSPENVMAGMDKINDLTNQQEYTTGFQQPEKFLGKALEYLKANS